MPSGMVGREHERTELATALAEVRDGRGRAVLLLGEAGMGKSMLTDWTVDRAATDGTGSGRGWCSAAGMPPLWVWERALESLGIAPAWRPRRGAAAGPDRELVAAAVVQS
ncbi:MAG TPA: ATP-binding protein [Streptosporangiaceae bacterium]|nr:ATP-binding protein [Streptosporangiaceae bacterium]